MHLTHAPKNFDIAAIHQILLNFAAGGGKSQCGNYGISLSQFSKKKKNSVKSNPLQLNYSIVILRVFFFLVNESKFWFFPHCGVQTRVINF